MIQRAALLAEAQDLIGQAKAAIENDRDAMALDKAIPALERAFDIMVILREKYSPYGRRRVKK